MADTVAVAGVLALAGILVAVASLISLHVARTGSSPLRDPVSQYGITDRRSGYRAATVSLGAACIWRVSESETTSRAGQSAPEV